MSKRRLLLGLGASCVVAALALAFIEPEGERAAHAAAAPETLGPSVALVATLPGAELSSLYVVDAGRAAAPPPVATFAHAPDAVVRAALVPNTPFVLATADTEVSSDRSFDASLFRLEPHAPPIVLTDRVVHASRPLVTAAGRVFVSRGKPGPALEGRMRVDALTIEEVDLETGKTRVVHAEDALLLFLAGSTEREILLYRVFPDKADVVAVDPDTFATRFILKSLPPFARDFSTDASGDKLVFQDRSETDARAWVVDEVEVATGKKSRLFSSASMTLAPAVLPNGGVLYNPPGRGLETLDAEARVASPLGPGVDVVAASTGDAHFLAALHTQPSALPVPFVLDTQTGKVALLPAPRGTRIAIAGFSTQNGGAR